MDNLATRNIYIDGLDSTEVSVPESLSYGAEGMEEIRSSMEVLTRVDLDLTYSSEKLLNLDNLLMHVYLLLNDSDTVIEYDDISLESMEMAMKIDLLLAIVKSEVKVLDNFMGTLQTLMVDIRDKISALGDLEETVILVRSKVQDTEETLKQSRDHILEMKMQLAKLHMTSLAFNQNECMLSDSKKFQVSGLYLKPELQLVEKQHILRMLEKSLARELDLEKKLAEMSQNEEDLRLKLQLTEQVALCMEEGAEVIWGRFLEAENMGEVLMGISKEMAGRLQVVQFTLVTAINREQQTNSKLQHYEAQLHLKDLEIGKLCSEVSAASSEVASLKANMSILEKQLRESMCQLEEASTSNETNQEHLAEMENIVESMREAIDVAENRAENAETKISHLTETNLELTEELSFLKGSNDSSSKKLSSLEKQLRDLEFQLQHARASSEASQEQQNMLYRAIWDMETLIDELKQKVSKAESKAENAEEQCLVVTEDNLELKKEVEFLRNRVSCLEMSLEQVTVEKMATAKDITIKSNDITHMVVQLALERERIEQKLYTLTKENQLLVEKLKKAKKVASSILEKKNTINNRKISASLLDSTICSCKETSHDKAAEFPSKDIQNQVEHSLDSTTSVQTEEEAQSHSPTEDNSSSIPKLEAENPLKARHSSRKYFYTSVFILLLSVSATYFLDKKHLIFNVFNG